MNICFFLIYYLFKMQKNKSSLCLLQFTYLEIDLEKLVFVLTLPFSPLLIRCVIRLWTTCKQTEFRGHSNSRRFYEWTGFILNVEARGLELTHAQNVHATRRRSNSAIQHIPLKLCESKSKSRFYQSNATRWSVRFITSSCCALLMHNELSFVYKL